MSEGTFSHVEAQITWVLYKYKLLCFHLSESRSFAWRLTQKKIKFVNFCHDFMQKSFVVTTYTQKFYSKHSKKKKMKYYHFFSYIVKLNANYAEIYWVCNLEASF